jgi:hypothetical protein
MANSVFPSDFDTKDEKWLKLVNTALESRLNDTWGRMGGRNIMLRLMSYASGIIPADAGVTYDDLLNFGKSNDGALPVNQSDTNLDKELGLKGQTSHEDTYSVAPKFINAVIGRLSRVTYNPVLTPIDSLAYETQEDYRAKLETYVQFQKAGQQITSILEELKISPEDVPMDRDEMDIWLNENPKFLEAMEMEMFLAEGLEKSNIRELRRKLQLYAIVYNCAMVKQGYSKGTHEKARVCRLENCIIDPNFFINGSFRYAGEVLWMTPAEVAANIGRELDKEELKTINGLRGNSSWWYSQKGSGSASDDSVIPVLDYEYATATKIVVKNKQNATGEPRTYIGADERIEKEPVDGGMLDQKEMWIKTWYGCKFVPGTNLMWDQGPVEIQARDPLPPTDEDYGLVNIGDSLSSFCVSAQGFDGDMSSMLQMAIPCIRRMHALNEKINENIKTYQPYIREINLDVLVNEAATSGKKWDENKVLKLIGRYGLAVTKPSQTRNSHSDQKAYSLTPTGMSVELQNLSNLLANEMNSLSSLTGFSETSTGQVGSGEITATVRKMANEGTDDVLSGLRELEFKLLDHICKCRLLREQWSPAPTKGKGFNISDVHRRHIYTLKLEANPNPNEIDRVDNFTEFALKANTIDMVDALVVSRTMNLKQKQAILAIRTRRNQARASAAGQQNQQAQNEAMMQLEQNKFQNQLQLIKAKAEEDRLTELAMEQERRKTAVLVQTAKTNAELALAALEKYGADAAANIIAPSEAPPMDMMEGQQPNPEEMMGNESEQLA